MVDTFPNVSPDLSATPEREPIILRADFGDGYFQATGDGINPYKDTWEMSFTNRPKAQIDEIDAFVKGKNGVTSFYWTPPNEAVATPPKRWVTVGAIRGPSKAGPDAYSISFRMERVQTL